MTTPDNAREKFAVAVMEAFLGARDCACGLIRLVLYLPAATCSVLYSGFTRIANWAEAALFPAPKENAAGGLVKNREFYFVYGSRRCGKTALQNELAKQLIAEYQQKRNMAR